MLVVLVVACTPKLQPMPEIPLSEMGEEATDHLTEEISRLSRDALDQQRDQKDRSAAFLEIGRLFQAYSFHDQATVAYENVISLTPENDTARYLLAICLEERGLVDQSADQFRQVIENRPDHTTAINRLARVHFQAGRAEEARGLYLQAIVESPRDATSLAGLGRCALASDNYSAAVEYLLQALEVQPQASRLHGLLVQAYGRLEQDEAVRRHQALIGDVDVVLSDAAMHQVQLLARGIGGILRRGDAALRAGDFVASTDAYRQAIQQNPEDSTIWHSLATSLFRTGEYDQALGAFEKAAALRPSNADLWFNIGVVNTRLGRYSTAIENLKTAVDLEPTRNDFRLAIAEALLLHGDPGAAAVIYNEALSSDPRNTDLQIEIAGRYVAAGQCERGLKVIETGIAQDPGSRLLQSGLVHILSSCRDRSVRDGVRAIQIASELVKAEPSVGHVELMAMAFAEAGRFDLAVAWQQRLISTVGEDASSLWLERANARLQGYRDQRPVRVP